MLRRPEPNERRRTASARALADAPESSMQQAMCRYALMGTASGTRQAAASVEPRATGARNPRRSARGGLPAGAVPPSLGPEDEDEHGEPGGRGERRHHPDVAARPGHLEEAPKPRHPEAQRQGERERTDHRPHPPAHPARL